MSASKKLSWKAIRSYVGNKKLTMATADEVFAVTKCLPGAVPPFGSIYTIKTLTDPSLQIQGPTINFNCGLRTQSISMQTHDYLAIEKPTIVSFTEWINEEEEDQEQEERGGGGGKMNQRR